MKVYYPKDKILDYDCAKLLYGCSADDLIPAHIEEIPSLDESFFVAGDVNRLQMLCMHQQVSFPKFPMFPSWLSEYYGGKIEKSTFGEVLEKKEGEPKFIKPASKGIFSPFITGFPIYNFTEPYSVMHVHEGCEVYIRDLLDIVQEWRVSILDGDILDICVYNRIGDFINPDYGFIEEVVKKCVENFCQPAFCVDVGITQEGQMVVIELTPGYAFGSYGMDPFDYAMIQKEAWKWNMQNMEKWKNNANKEL